MLYLEKFNNLLGCTIALDPTFGSFTLIKWVSHWVNWFLWWKCLDWNLDCFGVQSVDTIGRCVQHVLIYWQGRRVCDALFVIIILLFVFVCVKLSGLPAIHDMMSAEEHVLSLPPHQFRAWLENLTSRFRVSSGWCQSGGRKRVSEYHLLSPKLHF